MSSYIDDFVIKMRENGIIAIVRLDDLSGAVPLTHALKKGGIKIIEFTLTNPDAINALKAVNDGLDESEKSGLMLGIGSVKTVEQAQQCLDGGAEFIVSPITNFDIIKLCNEKDIPVFPGAYTPTEIYQAWSAGATAVKVFPARSLGASYIKDVLAPMPELRLVPTGGVSAKNIGDFEKAGSWAIGVGGSLVDKNAVANGEWDKIEGEAKALWDALKVARK